MRVIVFIALAVCLNIYYINSILYITEGKGKKQGKLFDSEDGSSFFAAMLFIFILFPFIVRPLMFIKSFGMSLDRIHLKNDIRDSIAWMYKSFKKLFTLSFKVAMEFLKK